MRQQIPLLNVYPAYAQRLTTATGLKRLMYKFLPIPLHTYFPLRIELHLAWVRLISRHRSRQYLQAQDLLVNLGSGSKGKPGWVNVDVFKAPGVNCLYDCRKRLPFPTGSVKGIFCEHLFEHIDYTEEVPFFLSECHRVLKTGGVIRIIVPDTEQYLRAYFEDGWQGLSQLRSLNAERGDPYFQCQYNTKLELINMVFRQAHQHKYAYDYATLEFLLYKYGFSTVRRQEFGQSLLPELCIDQLERAAESLYVEAIK